MDANTLKNRYPELDVEHFLALQASLFKPAEPFDEESLLDGENEVVHPAEMQLSPSPSRGLPQNVLQFPQQESASVKAKNPVSKSSAESSAVYQLKISLKGAKPPVWRRVEVVSAVNLQQLHQIIQTLFGLYDSHLHGYFDANGEIDESMEVNLELSQMLTFEGAKLGYIYDFGDDWEFLIELEKIKPNSSTKFAKTLAICTTGKRSGPIEDIGGVPVLNDLAFRLKTSGGIPDFYREYFGENDPKEMLDYFDKQQTNQYLQQLSQAFE